MSDPKPTLLLHKRQEELYKALEQRSSVLADIYYAGISILNRNDVKNNLIFAAHCMRELMEKLPINIGVVEKADSHITSRVKNVERFWDIYNQERSDSKARRLLGSASKFFGWFKTYHVSRATQFSLTIKTLRNNHIPLTESALERLSNTWKGHKDYFVNVSHHGKPPNEQEMRNRIAVIEEILINQLHPKTSENLNELDAIIKEGELNG